MRAADFVGIVGDHDVRMRQLGRRLDLALEPPQQFGRPDDLGREDFQGDQPFHPPMLGLQHQPHAALAELVQDHVVAQDQRPALARLDLLDLVRGQFLAADQVPAPTARRPAVARPPAATAISVRSRRPTADRWRRFVARIGRELASW